MKAIYKKTIRVGQKEIITELSVESPSPEVVKKTLCVLGEIMLAPSKDDEQETE